MFEEQCFYLNCVVIFLFESCLISFSSKDMLYIGPLAGYMTERYANKMLLSNLLRGYAIRI